MTTINQLYHQLRQEGLFVDFENDTITVRKYQVSIIIRSFYRGSVEVLFRRQGLLYGNNNLVPLSEALEYVTSYCERLDKLYTIKRQLEKIFPVREDLESFIYSFVCFGQEFFIDFVCKDIYFINSSDSYHLTCINLDENNFCNSITKILKEYLSMEKNYYSALTTEMIDPFVVEQLDNDILSLVISIVNQATDYLRLDYF